MDFLPVVSSMGGTKSNKKICQNCSVLQIMGQQSSKRHKQPVFLKCNFWTWEFCRIVNNMDVTN